MGLLLWSVSEYVRNFKEEVNESKRFWKIVFRRYRKIWRTVVQWTVVGEVINWLIIWTVYVISGRVMVRYIKFLIIVRYKVGFIKGKLSEEEYFALILIGVFTVLLSVSLVRSRISVIYFDWERR